MAPATVSGEDEMGFSAGASDRMCKWSRSRTAAQQRRNWSCARCDAARRGGMTRLAVGKVPSQAEVALQDRISHVEPSLLRQRGRRTAQTRRCSHCRPKRQHCVLCSNKHCARVGHMHTERTHVEQRVGMRDQPRQLRRGGGDGEVCDEVVETVVGDGGRHAPAQCGQQVQLLVLPASPPLTPPHHTP